MSHLITTDPLERFLAVAPLIDFDDPTIGELVEERLTGLDPIDLARAAFHFVRDEVAHSWDIQSPRIARSATDALRYREGICYAKSHLLAALLRRSGIPAGICYQRLVGVSDNHVIHALNTVYLEPLDKWIRLDARGNKPEVNAQFSIDTEQLAWPVRPEYGEIDYLANYPEPDPVIVETLLTNTDTLEMYRNGLPSELSTGRGVPYATST